MADKDDTPLISTAPNFVSSVKDTASRDSRFTSRTETLEDALKGQTVGLVHLSEFKKRRANLLEAKEREAANVSAQGSRSNSVGLDSDGSAKAPAKKKRKKIVGRGKLSFGVDDGEEGDFDTAPSSAADTPAANTPDRETSPPLQLKKKSNPGAAHLPAPTLITKATLRREAEERQNLRKEFNKLQEQIKNEEVSIPFVFYDGTNVPGGSCTLKKGEAIWLFLERARRTRGLWHRVSVDDLMFVRGEIIIPHHYELYYFIVNRTKGPNGVLFDYPSKLSFSRAEEGEKKKEVEEEKEEEEDATMTKVVDRRWYERNKHIFPASMWETFDSQKDYTKNVRRDQSNNAFFFT